MPCHSLYDMRFYELVYAFRFVVLQRLIQSQSETKIWTLSVCVCVPYLTFPANSILKPGAVQSENLSWCKPLLGCCQRDSSPYFHEEIEGQITAYPYHTIPDYPYHKQWSLPSHSSFWDLWILLKKCGGESPCPCTQETFPGEEHWNCPFSEKDNRKGVQVADRFQHDCFQSKGYG